MVRDMFSHAVRSSALPAALIVLAALPGPAAALERSSLRDLFFGGARPSGPAASARYQVEAGGSFVLDTAPGKPASLKFEGSPEIWALRASPGPRGDVIYRNDIDEPMLRATRLGGVTLFTSDQPEGLPAAKIGQASPPRMPVDMAPEVLWNIFVEASARASRAAQRLVVFEGPEDLTPATAPVFADAAVLVSQAFARVSGQGKTNRLLLARFAKVEFNAGRGAGAAATGEVVRITICPDQGVAGRPSSKRIATVLARR
jgi:hypothetical protein